VHLQCLWKVLKSCRKHYWRLRAVNNALITDSPRPSIKLHDRCPFSEGLGPSITHQNEKTPTLNSSLLCISHFISFLHLKFYFSIFHIIITSQFFSIPQWKNCKSLSFRFFPFFINFEKLCFMSLLVELNVYILILFCYNFYLASIDINFSWLSKSVG
jgi:hypothetical protein